MKGARGLANAYGGWGVAAPRAGPRRNAHGGAAANAGPTSPGAREPAAPSMRRRRCPGLGSRRPATA